MDTKTTIGNVCFIKDLTNNKILLLKRLKEPMQGKYTGVGGKTGFDEDINASCIREIKEETGLDVKEVKLKGVIKTILDEYNSSWILFVYTADKFSGEIIDCNEGVLDWVPIEEAYSYDLIGFIRKIMPYILDEDAFVEDSIHHDIKGEVIG